MTFFEKLQAAGLPVISADESGACSMGPMTPEQQKIFADIIVEHFLPVLYAQIQTNILDIQDLKNQYQAGINRLDEIQALPNPTIVNLPTLVAMANAIKDEALIQKRTLKALKAILT